MIRTLLRGLHYSPSMGGTLSRAKPYPKERLQRLFAEPEPKIRLLWELRMVSPHSGMRLDEICPLTREDIKKGGWDRPPRCFAGQVGAGDPCGPRAFAAGLAARAAPGVRSVEVGKTSNPRCTPAEP